MPIRGTAPDPLHCFNFLTKHFHGVPDPARLAMAVKAVLKPGGRFAIR
jgi:hypothetical protein